MKTEQQKRLCTENNISKTGYRAVFVLQRLIESPKTREQLLEFFAKDPILQGDISKDTVTNTINTLRQAGCIISRPTQRTNNMYVLKSHPFNIHFSKENVEALQALRESIITLEDMQLLIYLNNLYAKIASLAPDLETCNLLLFKHSLRGIDYNILNELVIYARINKHINICYDSPENGKEDLDFVPEYLTFENEKLYVWGYIKKYNQFAFLRVDKISRVNLVTFTPGVERIEEYDKPVVFVKYKLKGYSAIMYSESVEEIVLQNNPKLEYPITVKAGVSNKFNFFQKILSYGADCKIVSPNSVIEEFKQVLKKIKTGYENEKY